MELYLPLKSIVLIVACGTLIFVIVFIFAKRQITRFALKSTRGPHYPIGADAPKSIKREIERRLKRTTEIKYEPQLLSQATEQTTQTTFNGETCHFLYRMKAVDAMKLLDTELESCTPSVQRRVGHDLLSFLLEQRQNGPLQGIKVDLVKKFAKAYEHARHNPLEYKQHHYEEFVDLMNHVIEHIKNVKNLTASTQQREDVKLGPFAAAESKSDTNTSIPTAAVLTGTLLDDNSQEMEVTYRPRRSQKGTSEDAVPLTQCSSASSVVSNCDSNSQPGSTHLEHVAA